jgi:hypothetical protein
MTNVDFSGLYDVRDMIPEDKNFILATFLRGLYYGDSWFSIIPKPIFMENYQQIAEILIKKSTVKVACMKEDSNIILGYSILSNDFQTIHWVYVKDSRQADGSSWRRHGIARNLLPKYPTSITHLTVTGKKLMNKLPTAVFNPFAI